MGYAGDFTVLTNAPVPDCCDRLLRVNRRRAHDLPHKSGLAPRPSPGRPWATGRTGCGARRDWLL